MFQHKSQQRVNTARLGLCSRNLCARRLEKLAILNAGRTRRFAGTTTEAAIDVTFKRRRFNRQPAFFDSAHQINAPARAVVFVAGDDVGGAGFQTKPTMHAGKNFFLFADKSLGQ